MTDRPEINEDFADMLHCLQRASVEFVLVGAHALAAHGIARATGDIDIFVRPSADNAIRVVQALLDFGAPLAAHSVDTQDFALPGTVYQIGLQPRRIDLLLRCTPNGAARGRWLQPAWHRDAVEIVPAAERRGVPATE